jgi:DNA-binding CsgD family transcriptional regulator
MQRRLSAQEREILRLHGAGLAPSEIAARLGISATTVTWIVSKIVSEWGANRTDELARSLAIAQRGRLAAQFALPLAVMLVLTLATAAAIAATGTLHGPATSPTAPASASTMTFTPQDPSAITYGPAFSAVPSSPDGEPTPAASTAPLAPTAPLVSPTVPTLAPLPTALPTLAPPTLPVPLPPLPTVPPLPTPHVPPLSLP